MRIVLLAESSSIHTYRWAVSLRRAGAEVGVFTLRSSNRYDYAQHGIAVYSAVSSTSSSAGLLGKLRYLEALPALRSAIRAFAPDIVHAHYATSYGLLGALSGFHPYVVSVWGSDVYDFPGQFPFAFSLLRYVFRKADRLLSTSHIMAKRASRYTAKPFTVTPFGVDVGLFSHRADVSVDPNLFGCVKTLAPEYGVEVLIRAFSRLVNDNPDRPLRLDIVGEGQQRAVLERLVAELGLGARIRFRGFVSNDRLPEYYSLYAVAVFPSVCNESFGVVAVEAMACGCPVIASDADGFKETVEDGETGFLVRRGDVEGLVGAMQRFVDNPEIREGMGVRGRQRVLSLYNWESNVRIMLGVYREVTQTIRR